MNTAGSDSFCSSVREAATWSAVWVTLALVFNFLLYHYALWKFPQDARLMAVPGFDPQAAAWRVSLEFLTGYVVEKSLSVDNVFVFVGLKMVWPNDLYDGKFPITLSLGIITGVIALSVAAPLLFPKPRAEAEGRVN